MVRLIFMIICSGTTLVWSQKGEFGKEQWSGTNEEDMLGIPTVSTGVLFNLHHFNNIKKFAEAGKQVLGADMARVKHRSFGYALGVSYLYSTPDTLPAYPIGELGLEAGFFSHYLVDFGHLYLSYAGAWAALKMAYGVTKDAGKKGVTDIYGGIRLQGKYHELRFYDSALNGMRKLGPNAVSPSLNLGIQPFICVQRRWKSIALFAEVGSQFDYHRDRNTMISLPTDAVSYHNNPATYSGSWVGRPWTLLTCRVGWMGYLNPSYY